MTKSATALVLALLIWGRLDAQTGVLVVAHGASPAWNARVLETVAQVRWAGPVATAFLMGPAADTQGWSAGIRALVDSGASEIVAVPIMISSAGAHFRQIRFYAGELAELPAALRQHEAHAGHGEPPERAPVPIRVAPALDDAPELGRILDDVLEALEADDLGETVVLVAHGPSTDDDAARWTDAIDRALAPLVESRGIDFRVELIRDDAPPEVRARAVSGMRAEILDIAGRTGDSVTVLPLLVSSGSVDRVTIPRDLAGLPVRYRAASLAPSPHLARWIERMAAAYRPFGG